MLRYPLPEATQCPLSAVHITHLDRFPPQNEEALRPLLQESRELVNQDVFNLVGLLDLDADAHGVDRRLDQDALVFIAGDGQGG